MAFARLLTGPSKISSIVSHQGSPRIAAYYTANQNVDEQLFCGSKDGVFLTGMVDCRRDHGSLS
jgi:hypothetical protein